MKKILALAALLCITSGMAKNCSKGIQCGNTCISITKTCHLNSSPSSASSLTYTTSAKKPERAQAGIMYVKAYELSQIGVFSSVGTDRYSLRIEPSELIVNIYSVQATIDKSPIVLEVAPIVHDSVPYFPIPELAKLGCTQAQGQKLIANVTCKNGRQLISSQIVQW